MKVIGTVASIQSEPRTTKFGTRNVHYIHVGGERYQLGFGKLAVKVGDAVEFDAGDSGYGPEVTKGSLQVTTIPGGTAAPAPTASLLIPAPVKPAYTKRESTFPIPALSGERAIIRQNALTQARELVTARELVDGVSNDVYASEIVRLARKHFEPYAAGDSDMDEAKAEVKAGS